MRDSASPTSIYDLGPGIRWDERKIAAFDRRGMLLAGLGLSATGTMARALAAGTVAIIDQASPKLSALEAHTGGRLGLWAGSFDDIPPVVWRPDEPFLMCSTFKALAVAAVLARVDRGEERLDRWIAYGKADLLDHAPVTTDHVAQGGMALGDLCAAAIEVSDNTAGNLILASYGGPAGLTQYLRGLGDTVTRLDRTEPALNLPNPPGDLRYTTTPASMAGLWCRIVVGDALSPASRGQLNLWLAACQTGAGRLPAAKPRGWTIGHKTGTGSTTIGDVAVLRPPKGQPILIAAYLDGATCPAEQKDAAIADAGRLALSALISERRAVRSFSDPTSHAQ